MSANLPAYQVRNPSLPMSLDEQIAAGINEWCAEDHAGREFIGKTKAEAEAAREQYEGGAK